MPQPRVPTATQEARGSYIRHPERKRERALEPQPKAPLGEPPKDFDKDQKKVWLELSAKMPDGVASDWDESAFEVLVCLIVNFRQRRRNGMQQVVGEIAQMNKLFTQFGMTPADRSRVHAKPEKVDKPEDPWSRLQPQ